MKMLNFIPLLIFFLTTVSVWGQGDFKRYQYDEFIYGITVPSLKSVKDVAEYYKMEENEIYKFNQRLAHSHLAYEEGGIIFLPAGTLLHNKNIAFEKLENTFKKLPVYTEFPLSKDWDTTQVYISDSIVAKLLMTATHAQDCEYDCTYAVGVVDLKGNYKGYIVATDNFINREVHLYVFYHGDFITRIRIGGIDAGESGHCLHSVVFEDFDKNGTIDFLIKMECESYGEPPSYPILKHSERYYPYERQRISIDYSYYTLKDGTYINGKFPFDKE